MDKNKTSARNQPIISGVWAESGVWFCVFGGRGAAGGGEGKRESGSDGQRGKDLSSCSIGAIVKPPKSPAFSGENPMKGREIFLFHFLIPSRHIQPGLLYSNPLAPYLIHAQYVNVSHWIDGLLDRLGRQGLQLFQKRQMYQQKKKMYQRWIPVDATINTCIHELKNKGLDSPTEWKSMTHDARRTVYCLSLDIKRCFYTFEVFGTQYRLIMICSSVPQCRT